MNRQKILLHHVLAANQKDVEQIGYRGTIALNREDHWNFLVRADGSLILANRFGAGEDEWVRVFVPYDAPYLKTLGTHPPDRCRGLKNIMDAKDLEPGTDYEVLVVYPDKLKDTTKIWMFGEKPTGFNVFMRKGAFQDQSLKLLAELADYQSGKYLAGWRGAEDTYAKSFADNASAPAKLVANMVRNSEFEPHNLSRTAALAQKHSMYEFSTLLNRIKTNGVDQEPPVQGGGQAMSF